MSSGEARTCTIAARGSALSLAQVEIVRRTLERAVPGIEVRVRVVRTTGDRLRDRPLHEIGGKGAFTSELERVLVAGEADLCVHSMKDVPTELADGCVIAATLPRADVRDVLVGGPGLAGARTLADVPRGARIGTGSLRRVAQLRAAFPHLVARPLRGNVDTRLAKAQGPDYDGAILAAAGVERMGRSGEVVAYLPTDVMLPAAGQGAIGIEARAGDARALAWCALVDDRETHACVDAERLVLASLGGSCKVPVGAYARVEGGAALLDAVVLAPDGSRQARTHVEGDPAELPGALARRALAELEAQGARQILMQAATDGRG